MDDEEGTSMTADLSGNGYQIGWAGEMQGSAQEAGLGNV
jgi:hypothetical protein